MSTDGIFDPHCRQCPRLASFLDQVKGDHPEYHCAPVPPFGDPKARLLVVGLAPGMHGANASGRPFTGDHAGILLYRTLHRFGFASAPESLSATDGLRLVDCRITNAVKCLPPGNKPVGAEVRTCNAFLANELRLLPAGAVVLALGALAHGAILRACALSPSAHRFGHGAEFTPSESTPGDSTPGDSTLGHSTLGHSTLGHSTPGGFTLIDSYHCSRYNTQTRRLTPDMFEAVFQRVRACLDR